MIFAAIAVVLLHLLWILFVVFGAFFTRGHRLLIAFHIFSLVWGILAETTPVPCPLTLAEQYFENQAGWHAYVGSFLLHALNSVVYPDLPAVLLAVAGTLICLVNLAIYAFRFRRRSSAPRNPDGRGLDLHSK